MCTTRECESVDAQWDVVGDRGRPPTALTPGVHFWRLFARRGDRTDAEPSVAWEFVVPREPLTAPRAILDVNGDGLEDRVEPQTVGEGAAARWAIGVFFGRAGSTLTTPDQVITGNLDETRCASAVTHSSARLVIAPGDLNGDGYGDAWVEESGTTVVGGLRHTYTSQPLVYYGGPAGLGTSPSHAGVAGFGYLGGSLTGHIPLGDLDGDGFGDVYLWVYNPGTYPESMVVFGGSSSPTVERGICSVCGLPTNTGDFDADGVSDMTLWGFLAPSTLGLLRGGPSARSQYLGGSIVRGCTGVSVPDGDPARAVLDANDDGYDDLRLTYPSTTILYRGGPDGLSPVRCDVLRHE